MNRGLVNTRASSILLNCLLIALAVGSLHPDTGLAQNRVGLFWDSGYTEADATLATTPGPITGYLVIKDSATDAGIVGWEMCLDLTDRVLPLNTTLNGQAINVLDAPCFVVGLAEPILPTGGDLLLATIEMLVLDSRPVTLSLVPTPNPSLPGYLSYVPADDPGALLILGTTTSRPDVATINNDNPWPEFDTDSLDFAIVPTGLSETRSVTITNFGNTDLLLDVALGAGCDGFLLNSVSGLRTLTPGAALTVDITFAPTAVQNYQCALEFGPDLPTVSLLGVGREPVFGYTVSSTRYFGEVAIGNWRTLSSIIRNTGEIPFTASPALVGCGPEFSIVDGGTPVVLGVGQALITNVTFTPQTTDTLTCALSFGSGFDEVPLTGFGRDLAFDFTISGSLDFGTVVNGEVVTRQVTISNTGEVDISLAPELMGCSPQLVIAAGGQSGVLPANQSRLISVRFQPTFSDSSSCSLELGPIVGAVPVTAISRDPVVDLVTPAAVTLGPLEVGRTLDVPVSIQNAGPDGVLLQPALTDCAIGLAAPGLPTEYFLSPGASWTIVLSFAPTAPDSFVCALTWGEGLPDVALTAIAVAPAPAWEITPTVVSFPLTVPGSTSDAVVHVTNTGLVPLDLAVQLSDSTGAFWISTGGGTTVLEPAAALNIAVRFSPTVDGEYSARLDLGTLLGQVPLFGRSAALAVGCTVVPSYLDFGEVVVSESNSHDITVTNTGTEPLTLHPSSSRSEFQVVADQVVLQPGESRQFSIVFNPLTSGLFEGSISLGTDTCPAVDCVGTGVYPPVLNGDLLGIFFETSATTNTLTLAPYVPHDAYVILREPSDFSGVAGWEAAINLVGSGTILDWDLGAGALNVGEAPDFIVGLATPLPWATNVVLARFGFMVTEDEATLLFTVEPTSVPSLAGEMAWVDAASLTLHKMESITGWTVVAQANTDITVAIETPTPRATVAADRVDLAWPAQVTAGTVYHVYRRRDNQPPTRLTDQPLTTGTTEVRFSDRIAQLPAGTRLAYSYAVLVQGIELARSAEVEVILPRVPASLTRLLPNVPNPFNPQTDIRFELARPTMVRLTIYDVTGRQMQVLQDGFLDAGQYTRIWAGRDDGGRAVSSGAYYVRLEVADRVDHRKIMLLK